MADYGLLRTSLINKAASNPHGWTNSRFSYVGFALADPLKRCVNNLRSPLSCCKINFRQESRIGPIVRVGGGGSPGASSRASLPRRGSTATCSSAAPSSFASSESAASTCKMQLLAVSLLHPARALQGRSSRNQGEGQDRSAELEEISLLTDPLSRDAALQHQLTGTHEVEEYAEPLGVSVKEESLRMMCLRRRQRLLRSGSLASRQELELVHTRLMQQGCPAPLLQQLRCGVCTSFGQSTCILHRALKIASKTEPG